MKELVERMIPLGFEKDAEDLVAKIEAEAWSMHRKGYYYVSNRVDRVFENMTLYFEREIAKPKVE